MPFAEGAGEGEEKETEEKDGEMPEGGDQPPEKQPGAAEDGTDVPPDEAAPEVGWQPLCGVAHDGYLLHLFPCCW